MLKDVHLGFQGFCGVNVARPCLCNMYMKAEFARILKVEFKLIRYNTIEWKLIRTDSYELCMTTWKSVMNYYIFGTISMAKYRGGNILLPLSFNVVRLKLTFISSGFVFYYMFLITVQNRGNLDASLRDYLQRQALTSRVPLFNVANCSPVREIKCESERKGCFDVCARSQKRYQRNLL
jgi:hypothetical protein